MAINNIPPELRSSKRDAAFWRRVEVRGIDDCWPWKSETQVTQGGYGTAFYGSIRTTANRLAFILGKGPIPEGMQALHTCEDRYPVGSREHRRCCNFYHLYPGTPQDNMDDKVENGRWSRATSYVGDGNPNARITSEQVTQILEDAKTMTQRQIAAKYGISKSQVGNILRGDSRPASTDALSEEDKAKIVEANARRTRRRQGGAS